MVICKRYTPTEPTGIIFHWSNFTDNPDCQSLLIDSGRTVEKPSSNSIASLLYSYFFDTPSSNYTSANLNMDAIYAVNIIDGYLQSATPDHRLSDDPSSHMMQALVALMYQNASGYGCTSESDCS